MEHHSNIVPWQLLSERTGATLRWFGLTDDGRLDLSNIDELITERTKIVSLTWVSNILGTVNPVAEIVRRAHEVGALVVLDASQAVPHMPVDVVASGADFVAFTGHKMCGPTGIGVLWGRRELLAQLPPFLGGGEMIETVTMERSTYAAIPHRFEAGTPPIVEAVGLGAAVDYLSALGMENVQRHEQAITGYALEGLATVPGLRSSARPPRTSAAGRSPSRSTASTRTTWARCSTRTASPSGSGTTAPGRLHCGSACRLDPRVVLPVHHSGRDRRAGRRPGVHQEVLQGGMTHESRLAVPGDHPGPLQAPARPGPAGAVRGRGAPREPDLR